MKIKKITSILASAGFAALLASCSDIADNERLVPMPVSPVGRAVLVEDFTGQRCVNCPKATAAIEKIQEQYGVDTVISVGLYSGDFGRLPNGKRMSLTTETGDAYFEHWKIEGQPSVMVNRNQGIGILSSENMIAPAVNSVIKEQTPVTISMENQFDESDSTITVKVLSQASDAVEGKLQVWLVEDSIKDLQFMPDGSRNNEYIHNHVFRTNLTSDIWGDNISVSPEKPSSATYQLKVDKAWKVKDLAIVAFIFNDASGVLQAARKKVVSE